MANPMRDGLSLRQALRVYLVMGLGDGEAPALEIAKLAIEGGVTMIQLREKKAPLHRVLSEGRALRELCRERGVPFLVNDRVDVAMLLEADGVHVGQDDIPYADARRLLGDVAIIGVSAGTPEEAAKAIDDGADYLGVGAVYATGTKADAGAPIGTELIRGIRSKSAIPIVGIGGITADNAMNVIDAGADGIAVVSAITRAADPRAAASALRRIADDGR